MQRQLQRDAERDEDTYNKLACWCATNDKEKSESIATTKARIADLTHFVEELSAGGAQLATEAKALEAEVAKNQKAMDEAVGIYQKQLADSNSEEKDLLQSIGALKAALVVLSKNQAGTLLQTAWRHRRRVARTMRHVLHRHASMLQGVLTPAERQTAEALAQTAAFSPPSSEIQGILRQMLETFQANLAKTQKEAGENQKSFEALKSAKESEIAAGKSQLDTKSQELAKSEQKLAEAKQDIKDSRASMAADSAFLANLKEKCQMTDKEWAERQKTRQDELVAVGKALQVLSSDEARDLVSRTLSAPPALLQEQDDEHQATREQASQLLSTAAAQLRSTPLAALAVRVRLDSFAKVRAAIDTLVKQLLKEKADEIKQKDFCARELGENRLQTERKQREKRDFEAKRADLGMSVKQADEAVKTLQSDIKAMQVALKKAGENREVEHKEFQLTVSDQRETQKLLQAAISVLSDFYQKGKEGNGKGASLLEEDAEELEDDEDEDSDAPAGFDDYQANQGGGAVVKMLEQIITDAKQMEAETVRSEADAQKAYEDFVKTSNQAIETKSKELANKSENKAASQADLVAAKEALSSASLELEKLGKVQVELHQGCDFVLKNFELRQRARDEEVEALRRAQAALAGAKFDA